MWEPATHGQSMAIDIANRYFTPRHDHSNEERLDFDPSVDPNGILQRLMGEDLIHLAENRVEYYEQLKQPNGKAKYVAIIKFEARLNILRYCPGRPSSFRIGDIVEAQLSFVTVPVQANQFKMMLVLRSLALLDSTYSQVSQAIYLRTSID